jgi:hypothetical protein
VTSEIEILEEALSNDRWINTDSDQWSPIEDAARAHLSRLKAEAAGTWKFCPTAPQKR